MTEVPQPEEIYERTQEEGRRRLRRPVLEIVSTALAAGLDIVSGIVVLVLIASQLRHWTGVDAAHVFAAIGFGIGFVFLVSGRGELFTENFLVPIAGLDVRSRASWWGLARLWGISPVFNVVGGTVMIVLLTVHGVLPHGTGDAALEVAAKLHERATLASFVSAIVAGGVITAMTWFVEGQSSMLVRIVVAWLSGMILALGAFNHVIVATLELVLGLRYGAVIPTSFVVGNFFLAAAGNIIGGVGLVTLNRLTQGRQGARTRASA